MEWISVKIALPDDPDEDAAYLTFPHYRVIHFDPVYRKWYRWDSEKELDVELKDITHWIPLPEPPK